MAPVAVASVDQTQIERRVDAAVTKAVSDAQAKQSAQFASVLKATEARFEHQRQEDLASFQQVDEYRQKQISRMLVASNEDYKQ